MTCTELEPFLQTFLDDEFDAAERARIEAHLEACSACTARVAAESSFRAVLGRASQAESGRRAPPQLRARVLAGLDAEVRRDARAPALRRLGLAAAAAAGLATVGGSLLWGKTSPAVRQRYVDAAAQHHARGLPLEISRVPPENVEAWFGGKLDHRVAVPRLQRANLAGARLLHVQDRPAAYLRYDAQLPNGAPRGVGLFVFDDLRGEVPAAPLPSVEVARARGYNVALWRDGELVYELVTDLDEPELRELLPAGPGAPAGVRPASFSP
ncbi:MAG: hypothetical protein RL653_1291 [Pseudomonadota bacterium]